MDVGIVYWITGLSGAGKTTIGKIFWEILRGQEKSVLFLDGDVLREVFGNDLGYGREDRFRCAMRYSRLCRMLSEQGQDVIICTISMFHEVREWNRENIAEYREIYIEAPMEVLEQRNQKSLYKGGNNVVGVDLNVEFPRHPDIAVVNDGTLSPQEIADEIWNVLKKDKEDGNG